MAVQMQTGRIPMSREAYDRLPEGPPFYDYVNGEAVEVNRPSVRHQQIMFRLTNVVWEHTEANDLGLVAPDVDLELPTGDVFAPDILFLSKEHLDFYNEAKGDIYGVPDLIVEIHSPSTIDYDRFEKIKHYHRAEVPWLWFVSQDTLAVEEYRWMPEGYLWTAAVSGGQVFKPTLFPGLEINLKELIGAAETQ